MTVRLPDRDRTLGTTPATACAADAAAPSPGALRRYAPWIGTAAALLSARFLMRRRPALRRADEPVPDGPRRLEDEAQRRANRRLARAVAQAVTAQRQRPPVPPAPALKDVARVVAQAVGAAVGASAVRRSAPATEQGRARAVARGASPPSSAPRTVTRAAPAVAPAAAGPTHSPSIDAGGVRRKQLPVPRSVWAVLKTAASDWWADNAPTLGAALAYYTVFSLAPILIFATAIAGLALDNEAVRSGLHNQLQQLLGSEGAGAVLSLLSDFQQNQSGTLATVLGVLALVFGASGVFGQLQSSLNTIWNVEPRPGRSLMRMIRERFFSFVMVLGVGFLLLVSLVLSAMVAGLQDRISEWLPVSGTAALAINGLVALLVVTLLFAMMFKLLPDVRIGWRDVWLGATFTAVLFVLGKYLIGLYLGKSAVHSAYGAAGSIVVILLWTYYSAQILFFGAEFTQAYARAYGARIRPDKNAVPLDPCR